MEKKLAKNGLICGLDAQAIEALKRKFGVKKLKHLVVQDSDGVEHEFLFVPIVPRDVLDIAIKSIDNSVTESVLIQMRECCVGGDIKVIETDESVFSSLMSKWKDVVKAPEAQLKEV